MYSVSYCYTNNMKRILFGLVGVAVAVFLIIGIKTRYQATTTTIPLSPTPEKKVNTSLKEYTDSAGFTFKYPDNISTTKKDSNTLYASLELTTADNGGTLTIQAEDENARDIDAYLINKKIRTDTLKKVKLGNLDARQYTLDTKTTTIALDSGVLFTIITDFQASRPYWTKAQDTVLATFAFVAPDATSQAGNQSGNTRDVQYDGEETIE